MDAVLPALVPCSPQRWRCAVVVRLRVSTPHSSLCGACKQLTISVRLSVPLSENSRRSAFTAVRAGVQHHQPDVVHRDSQRLRMPARGNGGAVTVTAAGGNHRHKRSKRLDPGTVTVTIDKQSQQRRKDVRPDCCPVLISQVAPSGCPSLCPPLCSLSSTVAARDQAAASGRAGAHGRRGKRQARKAQTSEKAEHSPKTQQLIELAERLAEERGIGNDQTVRLPDPVFVG